MPQTLIGSQWLDEIEAAAALELPLETVHRFYEMMLADKRVPVAYYRGPTIPLLNGYTLMALRGRVQEQPQEPKQPNKRRRTK